MDIGLLIPPADRSSARPSVNGLAEEGQFTQTAQGETFFALLEGLVQSSSDKEALSSSESDDLIDPTPALEAEKQATMAVVLEAVLVPDSVVGDSQAASSAETDRTDSVQNAQGSSPQGIESSPFVLQIAYVDQTHEVEAVGQDGSATGAVPTAVIDLSGHQAMQPPSDSGQTGALPVMTPKQTASGTTDESPIRNGRGAPVDLASVLLEEPSDGAVLLRTPSSGSLISDQGPSPVTENQAAGNVLPASPVIGGVQSLDRLSTGVQPSAKVQEQGAQETTLLDQSLSIPVIGESGEGGGDPFGADAQGAGEGLFFYSRDNGVLELAARGNHPPSFNGQFTLAQQAQSSPAGEGSSVVTPAADHLKLAQALVGEDHSGTMTSTSGKVQVVHVELPPHDSGPLSVRISMTDQTVHTQFTTDRNDLGTFLLTRQDQLQQGLTKSGLELGQFQVHIDQQGRQEAFADRQSRRNGGESEQQSASQGHNQETQDGERHNHRPLHALSLFA
jgi:hypothetical protein